MIVAIDVETYEFQEESGTYTPVLDARKFLLGCAITDKKKKYYFHSPEEMYTWMMQLVEKNKQQKKRTFFYGHNTEYDWYGIAQGHLLDNNIKYICFRPFIAVIGTHGYILDTMAFYRMSLEDVGDILGFPKLDMPSEIHTPLELTAYLTRDVEITLEAILDLKKKIKTFGFTPRKLLTAGQLAMTAFLTFCKREHLEHLFMDYDPERHSKYVVPAKNASRIREAYRGGRNCATQIGTFEDATLIDIVALYAKIMHDMRFPDLRSETLVETCTVEELQNVFEEYVGVACCTVEAPSIDEGYLPIRFAGYQMFPTGRTLSGTWTFQQLARAQELGYVITSCDWYIRWNVLHTNPLKEFICHLHGLERACETRAEKAPVKMLRNSFWAKFAQNRTNTDYKIVYRHEVEQYVADGYEVVTCTDNKYIIAKRGIPYIPSYLNCIISTLISSEAQDYLYMEMRKVPSEDLLYCDTDSIMFKGNHLHKFTIGEEMGMFKIVKEGCTAKILGEKRYYIEDEVRISGVPKKYRKKENIEEEKDIVVQRMQGFNQGIRFGDIESVGSFKRMPISMKPHAKIEIPLPSHIDERGLTGGQ